MNVPDVCSQMLQDLTSGKREERNCSRLQERMKWEPGLVPGPADPMPSSDGSRPLHYYIGEAKMARPLYKSSICYWCGLPQEGQGSE